MPRNRHIDDRRLMRPRCHQLRCHLAPGEHDIGPREFYVVKHPATEAERIAKGANVFVFPECDE